MAVLKNKNKETDLVSINESAEKLKSIIDKFMKLGYHHKVVSQAIKAISDIKHHLFEGRCPHLVGSYMHRIEFGHNPIDFYEIYLKYKDGLWVVHTNNSRYGELASRTVEIINAISEDIIRNEIRIYDMDVSECEDPLFLYNPVAGNYIECTCEDNEVSENLSLKDILVTAEKYFRDEVFEAGLRSMKGIGKHILAGTMPVNARIYCPTYSSKDVEFLGCFFSYKDFEWNADTEWASRKVVNCLNYLTRRMKENDRLAEFVDFDERNIFAGYLNGGEVKPPAAEAEVPIVQPDNNLIKEEEKPLGGVWGKMTASERDEKIDGVLQVIVKHQKLEIERLRKTLSEIKETQAQALEAVKDMGLCLEEYKSRIIAHNDSIWGTFSRIDPTINLSEVKRRNSPII